MGTQTLAATQGRALWALLLATLGSVAGQPLRGDSMCTARPLAKYSITFMGKWSQAAFPKQYPLFRPPAQWSSLLGKHSPGRLLLVSTREGAVTGQLHHTSQFGRPSSPIHFSARNIHWVPTACRSVMTWALGVCGGRMSESWGGLLNTGPHQQDAWAAGGHRTPTCNGWGGGVRPLRMAAHAARGPQGRRTAPTTACGGRASMPATG